MKKLWFVFVLVSALLGFTPLAWPAVFYVTPTSDNDCSDFNCDFQNALNAASGNDEGDTINLGTGFYDASSNPFVWNTTKNYPLTIIGSDGAIIDGGGTLRCMDMYTSYQLTDNNSHINIENVAFKNCSAPTNQGGALSITTSEANLTIIRSVFVGNTAGDGGGVFVYSPAGTVQFRENTLRDNVGLNFAGGGLTVFGGTGSVTIYKNIFYQNNSTTHGGGIYAVTDSGYIEFANNVAYTNTAQVIGGGVLLATTSGTVLVTNNTLAANSADSGGGISLTLISDSAIAHITNNIIWNNTAINLGNDISVCDNCGTPSASAIVNLTNNDFNGFYSSCQNNVSCTPKIYQTNNKNIDPQFVNISDPDPASWDLRLSFGSECVDAGYNASCIAIDIRGVSRPQDGNKDGTSTCDMGAYEMKPEDLAPNQGTIGTALAIIGSGFGDKKGKVLIGDAAAKIITWTDTEIACTVKKVPLPAGSNNVIIRPSSKTAPALTLTSSFTVMNPVIDAVILGHGLPEEKITIFGRYFSTKKGKVYLEYIDKNGKTKKKNCRINSWDMNAQTGASTITFEVPKGLESSTTPYPLFVTNKVGQASSTFTIGP